MSRWLADEQGWFGAEAGPHGAWGGRFMPEALV